MEVLKLLSEITEPDERHSSRQQIRSRVPEHLRPDDLADLHAEMARLELPEQVPETIRSAFAVARNLWIYGWFHWPFHTLALGEALRCIEMALVVKCEAEGLFDRPRGKHKQNARLKWLFDQALGHGWIVDMGFRNFRRYQRGEAAFFLPPGTITDQSLREPLASDPRSYSRKLAHSLRAMRNHQAHPDGHWHAVPGWGSLHLEIAHDLIVQLFS